MNKSFVFALFFLCFSQLLSAQDIQRNGSFHFTAIIEGLEEGSIVELANYLGDKQYVKDSFTVKNGKIVFEGNEYLNNGIYLVVTENRSRFFEFVYSNDEKDIVLKCNKTLDPKSFAFENTKENKIFYNFNIKASELGKKRAQLLEDYKAEENEKNKDKIKNEILDIDNEIKNLRESVYIDYPNSFLGKVYKAMAEPSIPEWEKDLSAEEKRQKSYEFARKHFWDNVDFSENGLVYTPVFHNKLKEFFEKMIPIYPDSIINATEEVLNQINPETCPEMFRFTVVWILNHYQDKQLICMDKLTHHFAKNYYCAGRCYWADSSLIATMCENATKMENALCGITSKDMVMPDKDMKYQRMHSINKPVTVLIFWDHQCGHCKKEIPKLKKLYDSLGNENFEIYAVYTQGDYDGWKKYIKEKDLKFINVANMYGTSRYHSEYNINTTPKIFVLDENKIIRFKDIGADALPELLHHMIEEYKKKQQN